MLYIPPTSHHFLADRQKTHQKAYLVRKKTEEFSGEKSQDNRPAGRKKKSKTEGAMGVGRRTREEIAKCNQMTAISFQTGGRQIKSPVSIRGIRAMSATISK